MIEKLGDILMAQWEWDVAVMSQPWMYWCLLIPIVFYVCFFFIKWAVLTAPVWLPFAMVAQAFSGSSDTQEKVATTPNTRDPSST